MTNDKTWRELLAILDERAALLERRAQLATLPIAADGYWQMARIDAAREVRR